MPTTANAPITIASQRMRRFCMPTDAGDDAPSCAASRDDDPRAMGSRGVVVSTDGVSLLMRFPSEMFLAMRRVSDAGEIAVDRVGDAGRHCALDRRCRRFF